MTLLAILAPDHEGLRRVERVGRPIIKRSSFFLGGALLRSLDDDTAASARTRDGSQLLGRYQRQDLKENMLNVVETSFDGLEVTLGWTPLQLRRPGTFHSRLSTSCARGPMSISYVGG